MKEIPLTQGKVAIVDDEDFEWLSQWKWHYHNMGYAVRTTARPNQTHILMHREICGLHSSLEFDHINGNGLDNQRSNLRACTHSQNIQNSKVRKDSGSGFKGVFYLSKVHKWEACIRVNGKRKHLGRYLNPEMAACAYDDAAHEFFGEFARTNS